MRACDHCPHDFDGHAVIATTGDPKKGGIILCRVKRCTCFGTWSVPQLGSTYDDVVIPDIDEIDSLRMDLQTEELWEQADES